MASQSWTYQEEAHLETYSLLHRIFEETSATIQDLLAAGVRPSLVEFLAEATPRPGETPKQTAMRVVGLAMAEPSGLLTLTTRPDLNRGDWWAAHPDARELFQAEKDRQQRLADEKTAQEQFDYHFGLTSEHQALAQAGITPAWANALLEPYRTLTDPGYNPRHPNLPNRRYNHNRVQNYNMLKHLAAVHATGMPHEQYSEFVYKTDLTWKQIPEWHEAGFTAQDLQVSIGREEWVPDGYRRHAKAARRAVELTGTVARASRLVYLLREWVPGDLEVDWAEEAAGKLREALGWSRWISRDSVLSSATAVTTAWKTLLQVPGGQEHVCRLLDLAAIVSVRPAASRRRRDSPLMQSVLAWDATELSVERIRLLIAAGVKTAEEATQPDTVVLSAEQLAFAASMNS
jgi:hypothetical protein